MVRNAFIATEDSRFYDHHGIDPIGIFRAASVAMTSGRASQGASTITQQLARNFFLSPEKTVIRKVANLIGYDADKASGLFTQGGTMCNLYGYLFGIRAEEITDDVLVFNFEIFI